MTLLVTPKKREEAHPELKEEQGDPRGQDGATKLGLGRKSAPRQ